MGIARRSIGSEDRPMVIANVSRSVEAGADNLRRALRRLVYESRGIYLQSASKRGAHASPRAIFQRLAGKTRSARRAPPTGMRRRSAGGQRYGRVPRPRELTLRLSPIADENPVFGSPERYRAELGFADQRLHLPKQMLAFGSHFFVMNGDIKEADSPGR